MLLPARTPEQEASAIPVVIIDDHEHICQLVKLYLERYFEYTTKVVGTAYRYKTAVELLRETDAEIVFLDIDLTDGTGFDALDMLTPEKRAQFQVIVITTQKEREFLKQAIQYGAIDYLDKPLVGADFKAAVSRAMDNIAKNRSIKRQLDAAQFRRPLPTEQISIIEVRIVQVSQVKVFRFTVGDVICAQSARNYCVIETTDGSKFMPSLPLKHYQDTLLNDGCVRIGRGCIVNPLHATFHVKLGSDTAFAVLSNGQEIAVEPAYRDAVSDLL